MVYHSYFASDLINTKIPNTCVIFDITMYKKNNERTCRDGDDNWSPRFCIREAAATS